MIQEHQRYWQEVPHDRQHDSRESLGELQAGIEKDIVQRSCRVAESEGKKDESEHLDAFTQLHSSLGYILQGIKKWNNDNDQHHAEYGETRRIQMYPHSCCMIKIFLHAILDEVSDKSNEDDHSHNETNAPACDA